MTSTPQEINPNNIDSWITFIRNTEIPVLKHTAREISRLKQDEETISARSISTAVLNDPMMVFRVLSYSQKQG